MAVHRADEGGWVCGAFTSLEGVKRKSDGKFCPTNGVDLSGSAQIAPTDVFDAQGDSNGLCLFACPSCAEQARAQFYDVQARPRDSYDWLYLQDLPAGTYTQYNVAEESSEILM